MVSQGRRETLEQMVKRVKLDHLERLVRRGLWGHAGCPEKEDAPGHLDHTVLVGLTVLLGLVDHQVQWVHLDLEAFLAHLEAKEKRGRPVLVDRKAHRVSVVRVGHRDLLDQPELLVTLVQMDKLEPKGLLVVLVSVVLLVFLVPKDLRDRKEISAFRDPKASKADLVLKVTRVSRDPKDLLECLVYRDCKVHPEKKASVEHVVKLGLKEYQVRRVFVVHPVAVGSLDPMAPLERKVNKVQGECTESSVPRDQLEILAALENLECREQGV